MFKIHFKKSNQKEGISRTIDLNFSYNKNMPPPMKVHVHWMNLMKNQIIKKFQSLENLKERASKQRIHFLNHLIKNDVQ